MCFQKSNHSLLVLLSLLFYLVLLPYGLIAQKIQSSLTLEQQNGLWKQLLEQTQSLPKDYKNYQLDLTLQISLLQNSNQSLMDSNKLLISKNKSLEILSFKSMEQVTALEIKSKQLQMDLDSSIQSITDAKKEVVKLTNKNRLYKIGFYSLLGLAACLGTYEIIRSNNAK